MRAMRIFLFIILSLSIWGCATVEVTKEVIKVTNTVTEKVKKTVQKNESEEILDEIVEQKEIEIEQEIEIVEEKQKKEKNIVQSQQRLAEINFIGDAEIKVKNLLGNPQLSRIDGPVLSFRYDSENCKLFLFFNNTSDIKKVEYFELRNAKADLLNSKQSLEQCYREFNLMN